MAQWAKGHATKPDDLSLIPEFKPRHHLVYCFLRYCGLNCPLIPIPEHIQFVINFYKIYIEFFLLQSL